jgi:hypothetical protein
MKCDICHLESERADTFKSVNRFFHSKDLVLCPACVEQKQRSINLIIIWIYSICGLSSIPLIFYPPTNGIGLLFLAVAAFQLFFLASTILHELGHVIAGKLVGMRVFGIEIGKGPTVYNFHFAGIRWQMHVIAFGGVTYSAPNNPQSFKLKKFLTVLGGPLTNAILLYVSIEFLSLDGLFRSTVLYGFAPMVLLALSNGLLLIFSLWPRTVNTIVGKRPNDGLNLWKVWRVTNKQIEESLAARYFYEARDCLLDRDLTGARKWVDDGLKAFPNEVSLKLMSANVFSNQKNYKTAWRTYALLLGRYKKHEDLDSLLLNNIAYNILLTGKSDLLPKADIASRLALKQRPWLIHCKGTRGSVLVELGQYDEGLKLLHEAMQKHLEKSGKALNACYIGIAEARLGNFVESANYFSIARRLDPDCVLLDREK